MNIDVKKEDIERIGNAWYNEDGFLAILCDGALLTLRRFC
jgi:hypothetical protein